MDVHVRESRGHYYSLSDILFIWSRKCNFYWRKVGEEPGNFCKLISVATMNSIVRGIIDLHCCITSKLMLICGIRRFMTTDV